MRHTVAASLLATAIAVSSGTALAGDDLPIEEVIRFSWGDNADPANAVVFRGDFSCEGTNDALIAYLDKDSEEGAYLLFALVREGQTLEQTPYAGVPFEGEDMYSLCGEDRMPQGAIMSVTPEEAQALTGHGGGSAVCTTGVRFDDGQCDPVWIFSKPADGGLRELVPGRRF
jgi:hypothetical protein